MGNYRFKLSDMMPNAWIYKLKDMNKQNHSIPTTLQKEPQELHRQKPPAFIQNRASYYIPSGSPFHPKALDTHFPLDPPRKSNQKPRKMPISPKLMSSQSEAKDINFELPPVITKSAKREEIKKQQQGQRAKLNCNCKKLRMRVNSPKVKVVNQRIKQRNGTPTLSGSLVVIKNSSDPKKDFGESMMEMIMENELKRSKDLEELLACYLSLNSSEYHDVIVKVFEEICFDLNEINI